MVSSLVLLDHIQTTPKIISTALKCRSRFATLPQKYDLALAPSSLQVRAVLVGTPALPKRCRNPTETRRNPHSPVEPIPRERRIKLSRVI